MPVYKVKREGALSYIAVFSDKTDAEYFAKILHSQTGLNYHVYEMFQEAKHWLAE